MFDQSKFTSERESNSDQELWIAFRAGSRNAFSVLFLRVYKRLFRYGMNFFPCEETVKDSIQDLFLRLWKERKTLEVPETVDSYLFVSLRRILLRNNERQTAMAKRHNEYMQYTPNSFLNIEHQMIFQEGKEEREKIFHNALTSLTERQKEALLLRLDSGLSNREIADIMEISDKRVRNLICEAIKGLKQNLFFKSSIE